jgi:hypothetical protein
MTSRLKNKLQDSCLLLCIVSTIRHPPELPCLWSSSTSHCSCPIFLLQASPQYSNLQLIIHQQNSIPSAKLQAELLAGAKLHQNFSQSGYRPHHTIPLRFAYFLFWRKIGYYHVPSCMIQRNMWKNVSIIIGNLVTHMHFSCLNSRKDRIKRLNQEADLRRVIWNEVQGRAF